MLPRIQKILYATDLSPNAGYVLRYAINSAKKHGAKLIIMHVLEELSPTTRSIVAGHVDQETLSKISTDSYAHVTRRIEKRIEVLLEKEDLEKSKSNDIFDSIKVTRGYATNKILESADEFGCDAIIMGTHGKGLLKYTFLGSTAKQVLRRTRKPIFVVPMPEGETDITFHDE